MSRTLRPVSTVPRVAGLSIALRVEASHRISGSRRREELACVRTESPSEMREEDELDRFLEGGTEVPQPLHSWLGKASGKATDESAGSCAVVTRILLRITRERRKRRRERLICSR